MRRLVTGKQMKQIDSYGIQNVGIPSLVLMERAALSAADEAQKAYEAMGDMKEAEICVFCGTGNNGADGAAMARIWHLRGFKVRIVTVGREENRTEEMKRQLFIAGNLEIPVCPFESAKLSHADLAVDALFGVGLSRKVEGAFADCIRLMTDLKPRLTVAVDIPSGISSETGAVLGTAVRADLTVTFGYEKVGTALYPGRSYSGRVVTADIGFPAFFGYSGHRFFEAEPEDLKLIPARKGDSHKGTYGKVLIAAGSEGMCGAAYLSALAAYRTGAGLVKILTVQSNRQILQTLLPEAILSVYDPERIEEEPEAFRELVERESAWASVIVLGPGLGRGRYVSKLVEYVLLSAFVPIIVDADGLNAVAEYPYLADYFTENVILTPHLGEMARLTDREISEIRENLPEAASRYSEEKGVICLLKDAVSVTACRDGRIYLNRSGCGAMAKGGSGDVLAGTVAGLIALGLSEDRAAYMGAYIHGRAGCRAAAEKGEHSVLAREIADALLLD